MALDVIEVLDIVDHAEAVRIGCGYAKIPRSWLELITNDQRERMEWRENEFQQEAGGGE